MAETTRDIPLRDLKRVLNAILDHIVDDLGVSHVSIPPEKDFYWDFEIGTWNDVDRKPEPVSNVGRLTDDWEFLAPVERQNGQAFALMLIHAAPLLRFVGEQVRR